MQHVAEQRTQSEASTLVHSYAVVSAFVILALVSGWAIFLYFGIGSLLSSDSRPEPAPIETKPTSIEGEKTKESPAPEVTYVDVERAFVRELQRTDLLARLKNTRSSLDSARSAAEDFEFRVTTLKASGIGRRLATPNVARKIRFISNAAAPTGFVRIDRLLEDIERSVANPRMPFGIHSQCVTELVKADEELESSIRRCETASSEIDELLNVNTVTQPMTLREAIERITQLDALAVKQQADANVANERASQDVQTQAETQRRSTLEKKLQAAKAILGKSTSNRRGAAE